MNDDLGPTQRTEPEVIVTPSGHLRLSLPGGPRTEAIEPASLRAVCKAFEKDTCEGLLCLSTLHDGSEFSAGLTFWRRFGERYLHALSRVPVTSTNNWSPLPPPQEEVGKIAGAAPPMLGGEYLSAEVLERIWSELDNYVRGQVSHFQGGLSAWMRDRSPLWHRVGRVCFHLAENKRDSERPFAFLATYAPRLLEGQRIEYQPLGRALVEHSRASDRRDLAQLLTPVQNAAEKAPWVKRLVDSGEVFHPLRWTPREAYQFLRDAPLLEESGLLVRMPDWWTQRPAGVKALVSIGGTKSQSFNAQSMLEFHVELALEGEPLTEKERAALLAGADGLQFLKGRWVEVDREKLKAALEHWKHVERQMGEDGVSFIDGMRLLAGTLRSPAFAPLFEGEGAAWSEVRATPQLATRLREIREPNSLQGSLPGPELHATLRPYQEVGVRWLHLLSQLGIGACLADDMGLGKTIQVISLLLLKKRAPGEPRSPTLVVLPASLLSNWRIEMGRFAPSLRCRVAHPSQTATEDLVNAATDPAGFVTGWDVVLTSYGMLSRYEWFSTVKWGLVVLDEAQAIKNTGSRQAQAVKRLQADARLALTGTPIENRLSDLWSIFDFLNSGLLGSSTAFRDLVKRLDKREQDNYAPLRKLVTPYILRRTKADRAVITDLPDKTEVKVYCPLTRRQAALYEQGVRDLAVALEGVDGIERRGVVLSFILRFKQICNHPVQWLSSGEYVPAESGKFLRLQALCEEIAARQEKVLVYTQFRTMTDPLANFLKSTFGRSGLVLHGHVEVRKRQPLVDDFQREEGPPFFVLSLKAGGTGLNLTAAAHVIHFDRWWNPAVENQATDRAYRIGQKKNVMVHKFICQGTIEEKIDAMIQSKTDLAGEILEGDAPKLITEMGDQELLDLVRLDVKALEED
jgi:non-specific serine/threonine protein kinase